MRRHLLLFVSYFVLCATALARTPSTQNVGAAMTAAAQKFVASLDAGQRAKALMNYDDPARLDWHNIPKPERKGLQIRDMSAEQQALCHALVKTALSAEGFVTAERVISLENNLLEEEKNAKNAPLRDPQRYFLTIFGTPEKTGSWGWSLEGHHLSMNFALRDGEVIGDTPNFWGANPANVKIFVERGPAVGTRTLAEEEQLAFDLLNSLDESQHKKAVIAEKAPAEYRAAGKPEPPHTAPEGLPASDMTAEQRRILTELLKAYSSNLAPDLLAARMAEIEKEGIAKIYFAWAGSTKPGVGHYYRIQGPSVLLELVNVQKDPAGNPANHIHSVWRDPRGDFGRAAK